MLGGKSLQLAKDNLELLKVKYDSLEQQLDAERTQWRAKEQEFSKKDSEVRELCEKVLAKDENEMKLGSSYTWSSIATPELIQKAVNSFDEYVIRQEGVLNRIMDLAESRAKKIYILENRIAQMSTYRNESASEEDEEETVEVEEKKTESKIPENLDAKNVTIVETDQEFFLDEEELMAETAKESAQMRVPKPKHQSKKNKETNDSASIVPSNKKKKASQKGRTSANFETVERAQKDAEALDPVSEAIMYLIGKEGISRYTFLNERIVNDPKLSCGRTTLDSKIRGLENKGILNGEVTSVPFKPKFRVYSLTEGYGTVVYEQRFGEVPELSEVEKIRMDHSNLEHGYGIITLAEILKEHPDIFQDIEEYRRNKPIVVSDNPRTEYIPDISYKLRGKQVAYIEYETGKQNAVDIDKKCNKMIKVTRFLDFVVPNMTSLIEINDKVMLWAKKQEEGVLKGYKYRISTASFLKESLDNGEFKWQLIYDFSKGLNPVTGAELLQPSQQNQ